VESRPTASLRLLSRDGRHATAMPDQDLERLRLDNPAARMLPLLRALALGGRHTIHMNVLDDQLLAVEADC
jgi:hypothetical protein